jgi:membrane-associated phospholipid phosphatase
MQQTRMILVGRLSRPRFVVLLMILALLWSLTGCGTLANGRGWGQDAFTDMYPSTIAQAAKRALLDVGTLAPAAGAIIFAASDLDDYVADWASEHTPLFGSLKGAQRASDALNITLHLEALATALATPSGTEPEEWMYAKGKGLGGELLALGATMGVTDLLKTTTDRTRPDQSNTRSFPSGHASGAFAATTLANRNLAVLRLPTWAEQSLTVANLTLASGVAWARVEGGRHFPSDVLAGAAIGHFFSAFIHDAVLGLPDTLRLNVALFPEQNGGMVELSFGF